MSERFPRLSSVLSNDQLYSKDLYKKISSCRLLMVGAGGIGCELLKNLVNCGFSDIEIVDLDTIDLSNLNRQFLFQKQHVKKSKAHIARESALRFNPNVKIVSHHANIMEPHFDQDWYLGFDLVMNALDNVAARRYVNKMCLAAGIPLIESGTEGYEGQATVIRKDVSECYDCTPKKTQKTYPVCTIRSTPSQPIHCIVWAKSYLFSQLFGSVEDEDEIVEDKSDDNKELAELQKEAESVKLIRQSVGKKELGEIVFRKVFTDDINRLRNMEDMWTNRAPPEPLDYESLKSTKTRNLSITEHITISTPTTPAPGSKKSKSVSQATPTRSSSRAAAKSALEKISSGGQDGKRKRKKTEKENMENVSETLEARQNDANNNAPDGAGSNAHGPCTELHEHFQMYIDSIDRLGKRLLEVKKTNPAGSLSFDKDDEDCMDFVTATSNMRAHIYGIPCKTRWEVQSIAGRIIPAIATTNAVVAGLCVLQAFKILAGKIQDCRFVPISVGNRKATFLMPVPLAPPNPACAVCAKVYLRLTVDTNLMTLGEFVEKVARADVEDGGCALGDDISIEEGGRLLYDPDFEDNLKKTLAQLGVTDGKMMNVTPEDEVRKLPVEFTVKHSATSAEFEILGSRIIPQYIPPPPPPAPETPDDDGLEMLDARPNDFVAERVEGTGEKRKAKETDSSDHKKRKTGDGDGSDDPIML